MPQRPVLPKNLQGRTRLNALARHRLLELRRAADALLRKPGSREHARLSRRWFLWISLPADLRRRVVDAEDLPVREKVS